MNPIVQGLQVSVLGLLITFLALGVFILVMVLLQRFFPGHEEAVEEGAAGSEEAPILVIEIADESEEGAVVAAIAAALQYGNDTRHSSLGGALTEGKGGWWAARRSEANLGKRERRG